MRENPPRWLKKKRNSFYERPLVSLGITAKNTHVRFAYDAETDISFNKQKKSVGLKNRPMKKIGSIIGFRKY